MREGSKNYAKSRFLMGAGTNGPVKCNEITLIRAVIMSSSPIMPLFTMKIPWDIVFI